MSGSAQPSPMDQDRSITNLILSVSEDLTQPVASGAFTPNGSNNTITVPMRAVGLTRGFIIKLTATINNTGGSSASLTKLGAANTISNVTLTDLDNYQRVNTTGWGVFFLNAMKEGFPFGAALLSTAMDSPVSFGNNLSVISAPATLAATTGTGTINMYYWVPCAYGKHDLRGALYTGVVNATGYLSFTINPTPGSASGDATGAIYSGASTAVGFGNVSWTVYQNYLDQLPRYTSGPNATRPILPPISLSTQYRLVNTSLSAISANQDFNIPFTNFQSFLSTLCIYDQNGTLNPGTDINYWKLTAANTLQFFNLDPFTQGLKQRIRLRTDFPSGVYAFDFRDAPINTNQAGNMQITLNPSSAASGSQVLVQWESFANVNTVLGAQSLASS